MLLLGEKIQLSLWDCYTETVRQLLYFPRLFQFVYTVVLTDYFILMVVLMMVHAFFLTCKRVYLCSSSLRPEACYTDRMAGIWEDCGLQYIRGRTWTHGHLKFPSGKNLQLRKKNPRTVLKRRTNSAAFEVLKKIRVKNTPQNIQGQNGILMLRKHDKI